MIPLTFLSARRMPNFIQISFLVIFSPSFAAVKFVHKNDRHVGARNDRLELKSCRDFCRMLSTQRIFGLGQAERPAQKEDPGAHDTQLIPPTPSPHVFLITKQPLLGPQKKGFLALVAGQIWPGQMFECCSDAKQRCFRLGRQRRKWEKKVIQFA